MQLSHGICFLETLTETIQEQSTVGGAGFPGSLGTESLSRRQHMPCDISNASGVQAQRIVSKILAEFS